MFTVELLPEAGIEITDFAKEQSHEVIHQNQALEAFCLRSPLKITISAWFQFFL
jgi:hypothetical protein